VFERSQLPNPRPDAASAGAPQAGQWLHVDDGAAAVEDRDVLLQLAARLRENQVFGPPVQRDGVTVVPVAHVRAGGGLGGAAHAVLTRPTAASAS
jgi:hypothetical protein